jgi:predicted transcriptional regulator
MDSGEDHYKTFHNKDQELPNVAFSQLKNGLKGVALGEEDLFVAVEQAKKGLRLKLIDLWGDQEPLTGWMSLSKVEDLRIAAAANPLRRELRQRYHVKAPEVLEKLIITLQENEAKWSLKAEALDYKPAASEVAHKSDMGKDAGPKGIEAFLMTKPLSNEERARLKAEAEERLKDPQLLEWIGQVLSRRIVGESGLKKLLFLIALSYKTDEPQAAILQGPPSVGKSWICKNVLRLFPNVLNLTRITPAALDRLQVNLSNYIFYVTELAGGEQAGPSFRVMLSEGELRLATAEADERGKIKPHIVETIGTPVYITSTIQEIVEEQLASRTWQLRPDASPEQTRLILAFQSKEASTIQPEGFSHEENVLRCLIEMLQPSRILVPYAEKLSGLFPSEEAQARRDYKRLLSLIKVIALLHQRQRAVVECQGEKVLLASLNDLAEALRLIKPVLLPTLYKLPQKAFDALAFIMKKEPSQVTVRDVAAEIGLSESRTRKILNAMVDRGFLYKDESTRTHKYEWTGKKLEDIALLSTPISTAFFSLEEFENWFSANKCSCSEAPREVYLSSVVHGLNHGERYLEPPQEQMHKNEEKPESSLKTTEEPYKMGVSQKPISPPTSTLRLMQLDDLKAVYWKDEPLTERECCVCGYVKPTVWVAESLKGAVMPICEDCVREYQKRGESM